MFEYKKLRKNFMYAVGFAYKFSFASEYEEIMMRGVLQIYIVIKEDDEYKFVKYLKYRNCTEEMFNTITREFKAKPLDEYLVQKVYKI